FAAASQSGPARIWSLAQDGSVRNLTLGHGLELGGASTSLNVRCLNATSFNSADGTFTTGLAQIVYTRGASDATSRVYVNGSQVSTAANSSAFSSWNTGYPLAIGNEIGRTDRTWAGEVHLVAVYKRALSAEEIQHNFTIGVPAMYGPGGPAAPVLSAAGGSGGITLSWAAVPTAAKYRIYRRTADTSSALFDSTTTATTYFDGTAAEGVTYWYKLKAVNGIGVASPFSTERAAAWSTTTELAVGSVTGTVSNGGSIVIGGTGFGIKSPAAPILWDDFERGSDESSAYTNNGRGWLAPQTAASESHPNHPRIDTGDPYNPGGRSGRFTFVLGHGNNSDMLCRSNSFDDGIYIDVKMKTLNPDGYGRTWKPIIVYGSSPWAGGWPTIQIASDCGKANEITHADRFVWDSYAAQSHNRNIGYVPMAGVVENQWMHLQMWCKYNTERGPNQGEANADGVLDYQINAGQTYKTLRSDYIWRQWTPEAGGAGYQREARDVRIGYYTENDVACCCAPWRLPRTQTIYNWFDNVYIDNTPARVEIGNAATYASCTKREIQIPSDWSATSITVTVNTGTLTGNNYLFVIDEEGVASNGYPITLP
ncbi:LamG domain-containing protein, partial [bacterium]|nr:LamG domain-containing protein [bacterium]